MWLLHRLADPIIESENVGLRLQVRTLQLEKEHQADAIAQLRAALDNDPAQVAALQASPAMRPCECGVRWFRWHDGKVAGRDGIVGTADDDLVPDRSS